MVTCSSWIWEIRTVEVFATPSCRGDRVTLPEFARAAEA